jgi:hypothetical protein
MNDSITGKSAAETVHAHDLSDVHAPAASPPGEKNCCVCSRNVTHEERFKDKKGHYWCYECGLADSHRRHGTDSVQCPECKQNFGAREMVQYEGHHLCADCAHIRAMAVKRHAARLTAALRAENEARQRWRMIIGAAVAFAAAVVILLIWRAL